MICELTCGATLEQLNALLANHNIKPEHVLAVHSEPGAGFASIPARYRVLYRAD